MNATAVRYFIFLWFSSVFSLGFAEEVLIYLNPLAQFPLWEEIAGGLKQGWLKVLTSLNIIEVHVHR